MLSIIHLEAVSVKPTLASRLKKIELKNFSQPNQVNLKAYHQGNKIKSVTMKEPEGFLPRKNDQNPFHASIRFRTSEEN